MYLVLFESRNFA